MATLEQSTQQKSRGLIKKYLIPRFGDLFLSQITKMEAALFLSEVHQLKVSDSLKSNIFITFQTLIRRAVDWELLAKSPSVGLKPPRKGQGRMFYWSLEEISNFLEFHKHSRRLPMYLIALNTGMRQGEIFGLCWDCIDLQNGLITVRRALCQKTQKLKEYTKTKNVRHVGINDTLKECLTSLRKVRTKGLVLLPEEMGCKNTAHITRLFKKDSQQANVSQICFHDLRHTYATQFRNNGGTMHALSGILGHSSESMTARYSHFGSEHAKSAANLVNFGVQKNSNVVPLRKI